jgi:CxxC motif-containing protein (DUF1111 family)
MNFLRFGWRLSTASLLVAMQASFGQTDPGVRGGPSGSGGPLAGLSTAQLNMFNATKETFKEVDSVYGTLPGEEGAGLGPSFNHNSCAACHTQPATGESSPAVNTQISVATLRGARNTIPPFITSDGPIREARFKQNSDGSPDGGVHDLFVITGRVDDGGCNMQQTDFGNQLAKNNVVFRIPTPVFGAGLIKLISDSAILADKSANSFLKSAMGISGRENRSGNDGTITKFGWKAQNKSLLIFAGEAYNVEQGVTNEVFPNPRERRSGCAGVGHPNDNTFGDGTSESPGGDVAAFATFMRLLAPPTAVASFGSVSATSVSNGHNVFTVTGCALCHTESLATDVSRIAALSQKQANLFSDLLVHNMGSELADGVSQGNAGPNEFRTAPLWGLGQRIFFLHDGRTKDLMQAIMAHQSNGSEANGVITIFRNLPTQQKQDLLNFLRSL